MATAEELLSQADSKSTDSKDHPLVISEDFRTVEIPTGQEILGARNDHNTRCVWFDAPRFVDGTDMAGYTPSVMYQNARETSNRYLVTDMEAGESRLRFSWLVPRDAYVQEGTVKASVNMRSYADDGSTIEHEFNTTVFEMVVKEDIQAESSDIVQAEDRVAALVNGWESRVTAAVSAAESATGSASQAASDATAAASAANAAAASANDAASNAGDAEAAANAASVSAAYAASAANSAATDASSAATAANQAVSDMAGAAQAANSAAADASSAAADASSAAGAANSAATHAASAASEASDAATRANAAADAVDSAVEGDLGPLVDSRIDAKKDVEGGLLSYDAFAQWRDSLVDADSTGY